MIIAAYFFLAKVPDVIVKITDRVIFLSSILGYFLME
jgi:hypothetical protein